MKSLLVGDRRDTLLDTLEVICKHWGYRITVSSQPDRLRSFLQETSPDMLIMGAGTLADEPALRETVTARVQETAVPLLVLQDSGTPPELEVDYQLLDVPLDVFALFSLIQRHLEKYPRKNLRLAVKLPGMFCLGDRCQLAEVLSLSGQGVFLKTGARLEKDEELKLVFPLMGMQEELELEGRVLYRVEPGAHNNYLQGIGIAFTAMNPQQRQALNRFIECCFLSNVAASQRGADGLAEDQIRTVAPELTLQLFRRR